MPSIPLPSIQRLNENTGHWDTERTTEITEITERNERDANYIEIKRSSLRDLRDLRGTFLCQSYVLRISIFF